MKDRNPLEAFGPKNELLRVDGSCVVHIDEQGQERRIPIADIRKVQATPPMLAFPSNGTIGITTDQARTTFLWGTITDFVFFLKNPDEFPYAQNIEKYIIEFQASQGDDA